jgi:hypothetical protein
VHAAMTTHGYPGDYRYDWDPQKNAIAALLAAGANTNVLDVVRDAAFLSGWA